MASWDARNFLLRATLLRERVPSSAEFPFTIPAIGGFETMAFEQPVTFLIGENGAGKSTLLEAIAVSSGLNPEGGSRNFNFSTRASHRLRGDGLYLFDEPEAALSPLRQLAFLSRLHELVADGSQFVIATHSPILMAYPHATIFLLADGPPRLVAYRDTEHYTVTRSFLTRTEQMLDELLDRPKNDGRGGA